MWLDLLLDIKDGCDFFAEGMKAQKSGENKENKKGGKGNLLIRILRQMSRRIARQEKTLKPKLSFLSTIDVLPR